MAAHRPRRRRWLIRRRRFLDAQRGQVTDTWLHLPLLPRRTLTWRSPYRRVGWGLICVARGYTRLSWRMRGGGRLLPVGLLAVAAVVSVVLDIGTGPWVARIPDDLMMVGGLGLLFNGGNVRASGHRFAPFCSPDLYLSL